MREISLNGYIDSDVWWGDEITPDALHESLYGPDNDLADDVHITLNSYGGLCNAAVRMYDELRAYPGKVSITISGTAASAATVLAQGADVLTMTPGSLFMIHDPSCVAFGNVKAFQDTIRELEACKASILNVYATRCKTDREEVARMMTETTWMDAGEAAKHGFVDGIAEAHADGMTDAVFNRVVNRADAEKGVEAWFDRKKPSQNKAPRNDTKPEAVPVSAPNPVPNNRIKASDLEKRLALLKY